MSDTGETSGSTYFGYKLASADRRFFAQAINVSFFVVANAALLYTVKYFEPDIYTYSFEEVAAPIYQQNISRFGWYLGNVMHLIIIGYTKLIFLLPMDPYRPDYTIVAYQVITCLEIMLVSFITYRLWSANLGHLIFGLKVIYKENGEDVKEGLIGGMREVCKQIISYAILPNAFLITNAQNQNIYDKMVETIVVERRKPNEGS